MIFITLETRDFITEMETVKSKWWWQNDQVSLCLCKLAILCTIIKYNINSLPSSIVSCIVWIVSYGIFDPESHNIWYELVHSIKRVCVYVSMCLAALAVMKSSSCIFQLKALGWNVHMGGSSPGSKEVEGRGIQQDGSLRGLPYFPCSFSWNLFSLFVSHKMLQLF